MKIFLLVLALVLTSSACNDNVEMENQERDIVILSELRNEILELAGKNICADDEECNFLGLGSKPCGGYWSYIVYSNSIQVDDLLSRVAYYNKFEKELNNKWNLVSDCSFVLPPSSLICENGKCKAVYSI